MVNGKLKREMPLHLMLIIPIVIVLIYVYFPMVGIWMAFVDFTPSIKGFLYALTHSKFVGLDNFKLIFSMNEVYSVIWNTVFIAAMKIFAKLFFPLVFALLLNEIGKQWFKKAVVTITYMPYFLSWVVLAGILLDFFSPQDGAFKTFMESFGVSIPYIFGDYKIFPYSMVFTDLWKEIGFNTIIFLAALTGIDPQMYESAEIDGAGRWKQTLYITIPGITSIFSLLGILALGNILNANFDQIFNFLNPSVYSSGDIIDSYVYRYGIQQAQYNIANAVGLFKSVVSLVMVSASYYLASKFSNYRVL